MQNSILENGLEGAVVMGWRGFSRATKYIRNGSPPTTWVVDRVMNFDIHPPHARLTKVNSIRTITIAFSVLADKQRFQRLDDGL